jgi:hypothetical protein
LPLDQVPINSEENSLRLVHDQRFQVRSHWLVVELMVIFFCLVRFIYRIVVELRIGTGR